MQCILRLPSVNKILLLSGLYLLTCCQTPVEESTPAPNIIFILADDLGYGDISAFNPEGKIRTPNIDQLAREGMRFTDAHTTSSVCTPTRYGLLTGRYNWRSRLKNGVLTGKSEALIPRSRTTVASLLKESDYHTAFIGKWHLGWDWAVHDQRENEGAGWDEHDFVDLDFSQPVQNSPNDLGFTYAYGHSGSLDMAPYVYVENGMPTAIPDTVTVNTGKYSWWRKGPTAPDFIHEDVTPNFFRRAIEYIRESKTVSKPYFLYLALPSPHTPILPTSAWQGKSEINPYADFVMMVDDLVGQLTEVVDQSGAADRTLIIFTSDNGCSPAAKIDEMIAKDHYPSYIYRGHKADIFEGGHRVPFIAKWPDVITANTICEQTISTVDFFATTAGIAERALAPNEGEDSYDLWPLFKQQKINGTFREATIHHSINGSFAIRKGDWKLIMCPGSGGWSFPTPQDSLARDTLPEIQLYNLADNPSETENQWAEKPEIVEELKSLLIKYINDGRSTPGTPQKNDPTDNDWWQIEFAEQES
ncbi:MAG: arylsulfatase [Saprospiraceae bacterium]|nr:arylsulfatase [Saprospiraceae bacterium]